MLHPNGIAKGPKDLLYSVSSSEGKLSIWEAQSGDHSLVPVDTVAVSSSLFISLTARWLTRAHEQLPRLSDNVHVGPDGAIYIASFPRPLQLLKHFGSAGVEKSPVEVYRVTNETSQAQLCVSPSILTGPRRS